MEHRLIVTTFPRAVRVIEHTLILLKDGTTLAARIWLPDDAERNPVPAILEYLPYRKRDGTYERDALTHPYLAGNGYAGVRVDIRGSGESSGLLFDEYSEQEQSDGLEVIAWLAAQPQRSRGEFARVLHGAAVVQETGAGERVLRLLLAELPVKTAVKLAAEITGEPRNALYAKALELKAE